MNDISDCFLERRLSTATVTWRRSSQTRYLLQCMPHVSGSTRLVGSATNPCDSMSSVVDLKYELLVTMFLLYYPVGCLRV